VADQKEKVGVGETPNDGAENEEVDHWIRAIGKAEKERDDEGKKAGWQRFIDEYRNEWGFLQKSVSIPIIPINLIYAYTKTEIARLYFRDPWITVNPKRVEDIGASQIAEQIINYTWGELNLKQEIKKALLETILVGHSYLKVGYAAEIGTVESQKRDPNPAHRGPGRPPKQPKVAEIETSEYIKSENVFAYHVPYKDIVFDPSATFPCTHTARWMAHKIVKPLRAIKEAGIYDHVEDLKTSSKQDDDKMGYDTSSSGLDKREKDIRSATLWEIYDLDHMKIWTVSPGCKKFLAQRDYPDYLNGGLPFSMLAFNPVPGETFPLSDVAPQEGLAIELTKIAAIWLNHLKRHNRQIFIETDLLTPDDKSKYKDGIDGAVIEVQPAASGKSIQDRYFVPQYPAVQSDSYQIYNEAYKLYQIVSGQTPADQGGQARVPTRTLGELRLQMMGGHARADEKVDVLEDFIAEIARKLLGIMQKKYDLLKITRIVGPRSIQNKMKDILSTRPSTQPQIGGDANPVAEKSFTSDFSFSWNRQDILGDMDVDVVAGSTVPMDKESNLEVMEKMIPFLPAAGITPGSPAAKQYAREMFRMIGNQSLEAIMDLVENQPPQPNPKMMEVQAKVQAKVAESKVKIQGKVAEQQLKLQGMAQKLEMDKAKHKLDSHKQIINTMLQGVRASMAPAEGNGNGF
jgi:hypothetical protein